MARAFAISFLLHSLAVMFMLLSDEAPRGLDENFFKQNNRFGSMIIRPPEQEKAPPTPSSSAPAKGKASQMGSKDKQAPRNNRRSGTIEKNIDGTAHLNMKTIEQQVMNKLKSKSLLGLLGGGQSLYNKLIDAKAKGGDDIDAIGGLNGAFVGVSKGNGGLALRGGGSEGGGGINGTGVGLGDFGSFLKDARKCKGKCRRGKLRAKRKQQIIIPDVGRVQIEGTLDKEIIRRIIRNNSSRFKYCYERELHKHPRLQGKIKIFFQIEGNGRVGFARIKSTTMNNDRVEGCLSQRVRHLLFPAPKGGGIVQVNYPFFFKPS
ncbi:MAG: AgmX/PglI C-terminal domain-containing protein [Myxococcales bacterium]|nr:AgmX/PglI C-terminal domain-containing protein [Myxococcales bacterium]